MLMHHYIYVYCNEGSDEFVTSFGILPGTPFYVGQGIKDRMLSHLKEALNPPKNANKMKIAVIKRHLTSGRMPYILKVREGLTKKEADALEVMLISEIGTKAEVEGVEKRGPLSNLHKGGTGGHIPRSNESNKKISEKLKGRVCTWGSKISATHKEKGIRPSDEHIQKFIQGGANHIRSEEENAKRGKAISKAMTPEVTAKRTATRKANGWVSGEALARREELVASGALKHSEEAKANISSATKQAMSDPNVKEKMKAGAKKRWANPEEARKVSERNSKIYQLVHRETGEVLIVKNLGKYCVENGTSHYWVFKEFEVTKIGS